MIKGIHLEGLRVIGSPKEYAMKYYLEGADELIYMDCVASLYGRNHLGDIIKEAVKDIFIPITVGGGIRSLEDVSQILHSGADKVAINTAAVHNPSLIADIARDFGSQCVVLSVEAKQVGLNKWEVYTNNGREPSGLDVVEWVKHAVDIGAGEILLTSIDHEGTRRGFDIPLVTSVAKSISVPVIASGGMGQPVDLLPVVLEAKAAAIAMADILHYKRAKIEDLREVCRSAGIGVRQNDSK